MNEIRYPRTDINVLLEQQRKQLANEKKKARAHRQERREMDCESVSQLERLDNALACDRHLELLKQYHGWQYAVRKSLMM